MAFVKDRERSEKKTVYSPSSGIFSVPCGTRPRFGDQGERKKHIDVFSRCQLIKARIMVMHSD